MEFFINKGATLPVLKMQVVKDGIADITEFMSLIENSLIYFSMVDVKTGGYKILNKKAGFVEKTFIDPNAETEYYVYYKFTSSDTSREGLYEGEFVFITDTGTYILPIREKLTIKIGNSYVSI
jgi:hypothetical protein